MEYPEGFDNERQRLRQFGICGIVATAIAANVRFDVAKAALKRAMHDIYPHRQRMRAATTYAQRNAALSALAVRYSELREYMGMSVETFALDVAEPGKLYMVCYKGHVFLVKDGSILDQRYKGPVMGWGLFRKRLINRPVIRIDGVGW